ncbi:hypothetical protein [Jannaschia rubra]|uniref:hypothetical protein n=1 Tax=Jannaschia rubra TaxID=282197 RepID=UPI0024911A78|nr:hypothetical protein [Jannaschia rubra]
MTEGMEALARRVAALPPGRRLVALAGPPASGKSTLATRLADAIRAAGRSAQVVPMDGFHLDNAVLDARGLRHRKGAPATFDVAGLGELLRQVRAGGDVPFPTFDRAADAVVPDGGCLTAEIAVVEGNYLLLDEDPWRALAPMWDMTVALQVPEEVLRDRLIARWLDHGLAPDAARARAEENDLPNARRVMSGSVPAQVTLR